MNSSSPSFISLPATSLILLKCLFILKGHYLEIQVQGKVITFSLQVCLSKKNTKQTKYKKKKHKKQQNPTLFLVETQGLFQRENVIS